MTQWGLDNLFNPGKRHMDDEKRRLQSTREEIGDNSGGRRIDLEGGKVSIAVRRPTATVNDSDDTDGTDAAALEPALDVEEEPTLALANDEAEIEPVVVDDEQPAHDGDRSTASGSKSKPAVTGPSRRRTVSANAWSRRG